MKPDKHLVAKIAENEDGWVQIAVSFVLGPLGLSLFLTISLRVTSLQRRVAFVRLSADGAFYLCYLGLFRFPTRLTVCMRSILHRSSA